MTLRTFDDSALLGALRESTQRPQHITDVVRTLGLAPSERHAVSAALDGLVARGLVAAMPGSRYRLPRDRGTRVEGHFHQHPRGFAFVMASDGGEDVFIPATSVLGAMHGDLVAVTAQRGDRGREGVVIEVLQRRGTYVPGTLRARVRGAWVEPDDVRIRGPIMVDDPGADTDTDGTSVVCEITRWPEHPGEAPVGRVIEVLGASGTLDTEVRKVLLREAVEESFGAEAIAEADALPEDPTDADREGCVDLRARALVTIDPDDARDHDDAVHVTRNDDASYVVTVAIADVSYYVRPGTALDDEALRRGTSIYLPDRAIPMLPRALSSNLASLLPARDRRVLVCEVVLSAGGAPESTRFYEAVMRSHGRITYTQAARALGWTDAPAEALPEALVADLQIAADVAMLLRARRLKRGALDLDLPEARVRFEEDGRTPASVYSSRRDAGVRRAYQVIEELMLLANEAVAAACVAGDVGAVYRVHGKPDEEALARFAAVANAYGYKLDVEAGRVPRKLAALLRKVEGKPHARVLGALLLRALPQARYASVNTGHFGLASEAYLHFTSPIRRYPDLVVHRAVRALARNEKPPRASDEGTAALVTRAAAESSRLERRAMDVEREVMDLYRCTVAQKHLGELHTALVTAVTAQGPVVDIEAPFVSGFLKVDEGPAGEWIVDELGTSVTHGRSGFTASLGDELTVELLDVSLARRQITFALPREMRASLQKRARTRSKRDEKTSKRGRGRAKGSRR
jgi:ribonuclease R